MGLRRFEQQGDRTIGDTLNEIIEALNDLEEVLNVVLDQAGYLHIKIGKDE